MDESTDARSRRTRATLRRVILELATESPVSEITASRIAEVAGLNRSTFYQHADSPAELLRRTLTAELDALRDEGLTGVAPDSAASAVAEVTTRVLDHVESRAAVYGRELAAPGDPAGLAVMLIDHFERSALLLIDLGAVVLPSDLDRERPLVARYIASGTFGALRSWLAGERRDPEDLMDLLASLYPDWWPVRS